MIDWLPILTGDPSELFKPSDFDAAMAELDEYLKPKENINAQDKSES